MDMAFIKVLNMSISASWLVLVILLLRLLLKKSPKWIHVALWALVAVRLVCPVSIESAFSLIPSTQTVPEEIFYMEPIEHDQNVTLEVVEPRPNMNPVDVELDKSVGVVQTWELKWTLLWPAGMAVMLAWALISYFRLKKKVSASIHVGNRVYLCDYIDTPFILGIFSPKIYLPSEMVPEEADHVLAHERAHIARKDHWWKPLGYLLLTVYWFNPVLWLAYILLCRDIELACDERVIRNMEFQQKKAYSAALLNCSVNRRHIAACPLAFGEVGVKERVKTVLNYKKPAFWMILIAIAALIVTAVCFLTDPKARMDANTALWFEEYAYEQVKPRMEREDVVCLDGTDEYALVHCRGTGPTLTLYRYEKQGKEIQILDSCIGEYAVSGGMSLNHLEDQGKHIYFGTASQYHWNPKKEVNTWIVWNHLTLTDANGKNHKKDMIGKEGFLFVLDAPMQDFSAVDCLDTECLNQKKFLEQGYYMVEAVYESRKGTPASIPYAWTSSLNDWDIQKCWAYQGMPGSLFNTIEGDELYKLVRLLNDVKAEEIISRGILGPDDPIWDYESPAVEILCTDGSHVRLRYVYDTVIIMPDTEFALWETEGYWVIENDALKQWVYSMSLGGTEMLSEANRQEIRDLVRQENVYFFSPQKYEDLLFVGCWYDGGRGMAVACYEPLSSGYRLRKLIRGEEIKTCASGSDLYYCDYDDLRIFMILNQDITSLEFAGGYRNTVKIDTHPGLAVVYFPENLNAMYRFSYGSASTMYMDWNNRTHAEPPQYAADVLADPGDAFSVLANLRLQDIYDVWVLDTEEVDAEYYRAIAKSLSSRETVELLNILREIPGSAYVPANFTRYKSRGLEIILHSNGDPEDPYPWITLTLSDGAFYYEYLPTGNRSYQTWKIEDEALRQFTENHLAGDTGQWKKFMPYPKSDGVISFTMEDQTITIPRMLCFQYELTDEGVRFKPKGETAWIELRYMEEAYIPDENGLKSYPSTYGDEQAYYGYYEGYDCWRYLDITVSAGEEQHIVLLNDNGDGWAEEYGREISFLIDELVVTPTG